MRKARKKKQSKNKETNTYRLPMSEVYLKMPDIVEEELLQKFKEKVNTWANEEHDYWILFNQRIPYITLLHKNNSTTNTLGDEVIECLLNIGGIKDIQDITDSNGLAIIMRIENKAYELILAPYMEGVVKF